jgi:hypothetical protein
MAENARAAENQGGATRDAGAGRAQYAARAQAAASQGPKRSIVRRGPDPFVWRQFQPNPHNMIGTGEQNSLWKTCVSELLISLVQLGGLEPPTSCSTDRFSR